MHFTDILIFCFSILSLYSLTCYLRFLLPRNVIPYVSAVLTEAEHLLNRAKSTGVIPRPNGCRSDLTLYEPVMPLPMDGHLLILTVIPINSCGFGWKAIVLLE